MKCYISSSCSNQGNVSDIVRELVGLGFRNIELTGNVTYCDNIEETVIHLRNFYEVDIIVHNYLSFQPADFVLNLASTDINIKAKTLDLIKNAVRLSTKLGKDLYTLHPGFIYDLVPELDDNFFKKSSEALNLKTNFYQTLSRIAFPLNSNKFRIGVENLSPRSAEEIYSFLCTPEDMYGFLDYFEDTPNVGILLDLGHLNVAAQLLNFDKYEVLDNILHKYANKIFAIHISENDGSKDHHRVSDLDSWQIKFVQDYKGHLKNNNVVFEWVNCATQETFLRYTMIRDKLIGACMT